MDQDPDRAVGGPADLEGQGGLEVGEGAPAYHLQHTQISKISAAY